MLVLNINFIIDFLRYAIEFVLLINGFKLYLENDLIAIEIVTIKMIHQQLKNLLQSI